MEKEASMKKYKKCTQCECWNGEVCNDKREFKYGAFMLEVKKTLSKEMKGNYCCINFIKKEK